MKRLGFAGNRTLQTPIGSTTPKLIAALFTAFNPRSAQTLYLYQNNFSRDYFFATTEKQGALKVATYTRNATGVFKLEADNINTRYTQLPDTLSL
jgi:hypothetical protein